ncbi:MAG TPA: PPC domain-containing protein [Pirellulales bacterium]|nr:PPC domain-containing protein [Pirellulales bacterium]
MGPFCLAVALLAGSSIAQAQLPVAQLFAVSPPGGKQGTAVDLSLSAGADLDGASQLYFSHPGITAAQKMSPPGLLPVAPEPLAGQFTVTIAADVPPGVYDVRAIGTFGMSNPRSFVVGDLAEIKEQPGNNSQDKAMPVEMNSTVSGTADGSNSDWYKFAAKAGQRILIDCSAERIDSRMDGTLALYDAGGRQLARSHDVHRRDPFLDLAVPADGEYFLKVYDFVYGGGPEFFYRVSIGVGPYIDFILPPAGLAGTKGIYTIYGRNLPGGAAAEGVAIDGRPLEKLAVEIELPADKATERSLSSLFVEPEDAELDGIEYRLKTPLGTSNPYFVGYASAPLVMESEPNDDPAKAQTVALPCEFVGQFGARGDQDWIQFEAKAGQVFWIEVISQRLGLPTDPSVLLQRVTKNEKGEEQVADVQELDDNATNNGGLSFNTATADGSFRFAAPADGMYRALVRDLYQGAKSDPRRLYRLAIRAERPDFRLAAAPPFPANNKTEARPWDLVLRRGEATRIDLVAFRRDGFAGDITVTAEGLPAGVTSQPVVIGAGQSATTLVLSASDQAAAYAGNIQIIGRAKIGDADVARAARPGTVLHAAAQNIPADARMARSLTLAVTGNETAPFLVEFGAAQRWEMSRAGKLEIPVKVTRRGEIKGNLTLTALGLPPNIAPQPLTFDGATNEGKFQAQINANAPLGTFSIYLQVQSTVGYRRDPAAAEAAAKAKVESDKLATDLATALQAAETAKQAATKVAADADAALKAAATAKQAADQAATQTATEAKAAADKAAAAKAALDANAGNADLAKAKEAADKAAADAAAKAKTAVDAQTAAVKALADAEAKNKTAVEAKTAAEKVALDAATKAKAAADLKAARDKRAADTTNAAAPKDLALFEPSTTATFTVTPSPVTFAATAPPAVKQGAQVEFPIKLTRLYNYADPVQLQIALPNGVGGINIPAVTVPAGQVDAKIIVQVAANATPGTHQLTVKAISTLNGQQTTIEQPVNLAVEKVEAVK